MLTIDGSVLEGVFIFILFITFKGRIFIIHLHFQGGQIVRMAIAFSALTKKSIKITKIRAARAKGGLARQHLKGIQMQTSLINLQIVISCIFVSQEFSWSKKYVVRMSPDSVLVQLKSNFIQDIVCVAPNMLWMLLPGLYAATEW